MCRSMVVAGSATSERQSARDSELGSAETFGHPALGATSAKLWNVTTAEAIEAQVELLAARIGASDSLLPTYERSEHSGRPHIEVSSDGALHWVVCERGQEFQRRTTFSRDDLLYWTFEAVTAEMASRWEVQHRIETEDFRKQLFTKQFELPDSLDPAWTTRRMQELGQLLGDAGL